jgi:hypothetical protein
MLHPILCNRLRREASEQQVHSPDEQLNRSLLQRVRQVAHQRKHVFPLIIQKLRE